MLNSQTVNSETSGYVSGVIAWCRFDWSSSHATEGPYPMQILGLEKNHYTQNSHLGLCSVGGPLLKVVFPYFIIL